MGTSLIESLRTTVDDILGPILAGTRRVALLDFPTHANVGDSAIWLGTLAYLREKGKVVCYSCYYDLRWNGRELVRALRAWSSPRAVVERGWHMLAGAARWVDMAHLPAPITRDEAPSLAPRALLSSPVEPS